MMEWGEESEAVSFPGLEPPNGAVEIGRVVHGKTMYIYYRDDFGQLYYDTAAGLEFKRMMEAARRRMRIAKK